MTSVAGDAPTRINIDQGVPWCLTEEDRTWRATLRDFAESRLSPTVAKRHADAVFDEGIYDELGQLGVFGLMLPDGDDVDVRRVTSLCLATEELARIDSGTAASAHVQTISVALFNHLLREDQSAYRELLPDLVSGRAFVSFGLTEPTGGSDAGNIATRAVRSGSDWVINGAKEFITNSGTSRSRFVVLLAATGEGGRPGRPSVSAFLVPLDAEGVQVGGAYEKLGWRTSDTHPLFFDDVRVPAEALLGIEGRGYASALEFLTWARLPIASMSVGLAQGCLEETIGFVGDRSSFTRPLGAHQGVAFQVADIAAMTAAARTVTYDACYKYDRGLPFRQEAAICKLVASELANRVAYTATQLHGGYGFVDESAVARHFADARILTIGEGTSEVQRLLIARSLGMPL